jgi:hypothetical protein
MQPFSRRTGTLNAPDDGAFVARFERRPCLLFMDFAFGGKPSRLRPTTQIRYSFAMTNNHKRRASARGAMPSERQLVRRMWKSITREIQGHAQTSLAKGNEILKVVNNLDDSVSIIARHLAWLEEQKRNASTEAK